MPKLFYILLPQFLITFQEKKILSFRLKIFWNVSTNSSSFEMLDKIAFFMGSFPLVRIAMGMYDLCHSLCECLHPSPVIPEALYNQRIEGLDWALVLSYLGSTFCYRFI